jgi:hypothetical protein
MESHNPSLRGAGWLAANSQLPHAALDLSGTRMSSRRSSNSSTAIQGSLKATEMGAFDMTGRGRTRPPVLRGLPDCVQHGICAISPIQYWGDYHVAYANRSWMCTDTQGD